MQVNVLDDTEDERTLFQPLEAGAAARPAQAGSLPEGTLLNNIYQVRRFIARGGMGEVYEGFNVNTDERVAIKVMLAHLAAEPRVQAMFRKEARILTELAHPALVRYRVLAQEPALQLFYIVTEFIDGQSLSELVGRLTPSVDEIKALTRRLAEGLAAAHELGAIHRDISPDNVLLPGGRLDQAKIIDFGIAKDLNPANQTMIGDSFAGKLGYVAPEQFGDFGRSIGPWTDVYSLGLVILALAAGRAPDMGVTLVEAVDRRREGVDLELLPTALKPVFERMLAPDPANRFQTMDEVIKALDAPDLDDEAARAAANLRSFYNGLQQRPSPPETAAAPPSRPALDEVEGAKAPSARAMIFGGVALAGLLAVASAALLLHPAKPPRAPVKPAAASLARLAASAAAFTIPQVACSLVQVSAAGGSGPARLTGAAADPSAVQAAANGADSSGVVAVGPAACPILDGLRGLGAARLAPAASLTALDPVSEMSAATPGCPAGRWARPAMAIAPGGPGADFALYAVGPSGRVELAASSRAVLTDLGRRYPGLVQPAGDGYRYAACRGEAGAAALMLVQGRGPFDLGLAPQRGGWPASMFMERFIALAQQNGWSARLAWYRVSDPSPGAAPKSIPANAALRGQQRPLPTAGTPAESAAEVRAAQAPAVAAPEQRSAAAPAADNALPKGVEPCWRAVGGGWSHIGYVSRSACLAQVFSGRCEVTYGRWGKEQFRRYDGKLQAKGSGPFSAWRTAGASECPATPAGAAR